MGTLAQLLSGGPEEEDVEALDLDQLLRQQDARRAKVQSRRAQLREVIAQNRYVRFAGVVATHTNRSVRATGSAALLKTWVRDLLQEFDEEAPMAVQALLGEGEAARDAFADQEIEELQNELDEQFDERALPFEPVEGVELSEPEQEDPVFEQQQQQQRGARVFEEEPGAVAFDEGRGAGVFDSPLVTPIGGRSRVGSVTDTGSPFTGDIGSSPIGMGGSPLAQGVAAARDFRDLHAFLADDDDDATTAAARENNGSRNNSLPRRQQTRRNVSQGSSAAAAGGGVQRRARPVADARRHILPKIANNKRSSRGVRSSARPTAPLVMAAAGTPGRRRIRRHHDERHQDRLSEPQPTAIEGRGVALGVAFALPRDQDVSDLFVKRENGSWVWSERLAGAVFAAFQRVKMRCTGPLRNAQHYNDILSGGSDEAYSLFARLVAAELTVSETMVPTHALLERAYSWNMENIERIINALRFFSFSPTSNPMIASLPRDTLQQAYEGHRMAPGERASEAHQAALALRDMGFGGSLYNM